MSDAAERPPLIDELNELKRVLADQQKQTIKWRNLATDRQVEIDNLKSANRQQATWIDRLTEAIARHGTSRND